MCFITSYIAEVVSVVDVVFVTVDIGIFLIGCSDIMKDKQ